jgi:hypothetical protein
MAGKQGGTKQTAAQRAQAEVAVQQLHDFKQRWAPVQRQMADTIMRAGGRESAERKQAQGMATTDTAAQFGDAQSKLREQSEAAGLGGSTRQKLGMAGLADDAAMSAGMGVAGADQRIDDGYVQALGQVMALGRGEKAQAMQGMSDIARRSGQQASADASMALQRRAGNAQVAGQVLGMGLSGALSPAPAAPNTFTQPDASGVYANPAGDTYGYQGATLPQGMRGGF